MYFDAPIHLHGHEMFIVGDFARIQALLDPVLWQDIKYERWREDYAPLERFPTPVGDMATWDNSVTGYSQDLLNDIRKNCSVSLITITATKRSGQAV